MDNEPYQLFNDSLTFGLKGELNFINKKNASIGENILKITFLLTLNPETNSYQKKFFILLLVMID